MIVYSLRIRQWEVSISYTSGGLLELDLALRAVVKSQTPSAWRVLDRKSLRYEK